ncbi:MFS transporter [Tateyamaria omphalii]|uniref:MFS transporter n=1 Tax=Tateyamaria omphalii TaxID=299262 RepID=A0A1P8MZ99_9RHOB|nr:MFS transporter [Tateyamaria omphalii]APX13312.1 MFS transporter [Tateyamaria omphalii]
MAEISLKRRIQGWMAFDWATQPFYTLGLTFIFGPFFAQASLEYFLTVYSDEEVAKAASQSTWFWGQTIAGLLIAFTAPMIGAYADSTGRRMPWIWLFAIIYVPFTFSLWYTDPSGANIYLILFCFNLAFIAAEFMLIFVNAVLPSLGDKDEVGKISGNGAAIGYWGGVLSLFLMLLLFVTKGDGTTILGNVPLLGLDPERSEDFRFVGPFIAIWFIIFMVPFFLWVREPKQANRQGGVADAMRDLKQSLKGAYHRKSLLNFLISSMLYRDALNALYAAGGIYARLVLEWSIMQILVFGIVGAITAAIATQIGGIFDKRKGPRPVIRVCCYILILVCLVIVGMNRDSFFGLIAMPEGSAIPDIVFYICGAAIGGAGGAIYAASRSMMVRHTHPERPTEAFGLFALSGKATAFLAPMLIALFSTMTGSAQLGYIPVIALFILGLWLLRYVNPEGDHAKWSTSAVPVP